MVGEDDELDLNYDDDGILSETQEQQQARADSVQPSGDGKALRRGSARCVGGGSRVLLRNAGGQQLSQGHKVGADLEESVAQPRPAAAAGQGQVVPPRLSKARPVATGRSRSSCALLTEALLLISSQRVPCDAGAGLAASSTVPLPQPSPPPLMPPVEGMPLQAVCPCA